MDPARLHPGHVAALAGAGLLVMSLFMPWYDFDLAGALNGAAAGPFADLLKNAGPVSLSGWKALGTLDVVLAALAAAVAAAVALTANGALNARPDSAIALTGGVAALLVLYRLTTPPLSGSPLGEGLLQPRSGLHAALLGAALILAGGLWAASSPAPTRRAAAEALP
jgi:hypothetical protein